MNRTKTLYRASVAGSLAAAGGAAVLGAVGLTGWAISLLAVTGGGAVAASHLRMRMLSNQQAQQRRRDAAQAAKEVALRQNIGDLRDDLTRRLEDVEAVIAGTESVLLAELVTHRPRGGDA